MSEALEVFPMHLEVGDMILAYSVDMNRKVAMKVKDVLITTDKAGDKLYHCQGHGGTSMTFPHVTKVRVLRDGR